MLCEFGSDNYVQINFWDWVILVGITSPRDVILSLSYRKKLLNFFLMKNSGQRKTQVSMTRPL